jgi:hypothetical protein
MIGICCVSCLAAVILIFSTHLAVFGFSIAETLLNLVFLHELGKYIDEIQKYHHKKSKYYASL